MKTHSIILGFLFLLLNAVCTAQVATDCSVAIPICNNTPVNGGTSGFGNDDFSGASSSGCLEQTTSGAIESNAAWYRFRTGASGQLGFNIGFDTSEDWDFALYRASDCNALGEPIRCNFFDNRDNEAFMGVGEYPTGATDSVLYEDWLEVVPGEDYYLLINNFSNTNSGFSIQFSGNIFVTDPFTALDCSIISNLLGPPIAACEGENIVLDATTTDALSYDWFLDIGTGFLPISGANNPTLNVTTDGVYRIAVFTTSSTTIISDVQVAFSPVPTTFAITDEAACSDADEYDLSQKDIEALGTQDPNEVLISYHTTAADAISGANSLPKQYVIGSGTETIYVRAVSVPNPNCFDASQQFQLTALETPILDFPQEVFLCDGAATITLGDPVTNPAYSYSWDSGENTATIDVAQAGVYTLTVTNSLGALECTSIRAITVVISNPPEIAEINVSDLQENNTISVTTVAVGAYEYQLDDGAFQTSPIFTNVTPGTHQLTINDLNGCGAITENITVVGFPPFFTPNGDGANDEWHIEGVSNLNNATVSIFDRYGKLLKQLSDTSTGWDGTFNGKPLPSTDYWFRLNYAGRDGQAVEAKYLRNHFALRR